MPQFCTCGAELPSDARFCHRCGKPQQDESAAAETPIPQPTPAVLVQAAAAAPDHREMNFHNPVAVRVGLSMASAAALLSWLPLVNFGFVIWWVAAGFCSVYLYHRRTGELLSVRNGLRIGWITGILTFAMMTVLFTISIIPLAVSNGGLAGLYQEQIRNMPVHDANMDQALRMFQTPSGLATILLFTLVVFFGIITFLCTAGGALGAKIVGRE